MDAQLSSSLVHSILDAAGSMQRLEEELDHISIHQGLSGSRLQCTFHETTCMSRSAQCLATWPMESVEFPETVSLRGSTGILSDSFDVPASSGTSSKLYDSAIGSQSDCDSLHSQSPTMEQIFDYSEESLGRQLHSYFPAAISGRNAEEMHHQSLPDLATDSISPVTTPSKQSDNLHQRSGHLASGKLLKDTAKSLNVSVQALNVTWSETPQELHAEVVRMQPELTTQTIGHILPSREIITCPPPDRKPSLAVSGPVDPETVPRTRGDASSSGIGYNSVAFSAARDGRNVLESLSNFEDGELRSSEGSSSTVTPESDEQDSSEMTLPAGAQRDIAEKITAKSNKLPTAEIAESSPHDEEASGQTTRLQYHESTTPTSIIGIHPPQKHQPSSQLPNRYRDVPTANHASLPQHRKTTRSLKQRNSILRRFQRRHGSFKREGKPRKHIPVKRSHSDRTAYSSSSQTQKPQYNSREDLFGSHISTPSSLRPIGRMVDMHAGSVHIVQLHKPLNGRYGIYITEGLTQGVFISRFADQTAEKFYSGLLAPGDEIVRVNGQPVQGKSLDYVHSLLTTLDSVVLTVLPVCGRHDWWIAV